MTITAIGVGLAMHKKILSYNVELNSRWSWRGSVFTSLLDYVICSLNNEGYTIPVYVTCNTVLSTKVSLYYCTYGQKRNAK